MMINEDKKMIMVENMIEDMVIKDMRRGGAHVSPIEPIVEYAYHQRPQWKRKAPSCGTH